MELSSKIKKSLLTLLIVFSMIQIMMFFLITNEKGLSIAYALIIFSIVFFQVLAFFSKIHKEIISQDRSSFYIGMGSLLNAVSFAVSASFLIGDTLNKSIIIFIILLIILIFTSFLFWLFLKKFLRKQDGKYNDKSIFSKTPVICVIAVIIAFLRLFSTTDAMSIILVIGAIALTICVPLIIIYNPKNKRSPIKNQSGDGEGK